MLRALADWLGIRPGELRKVGLFFLGAFLVIAFLILARSLREALYLTAFPVETLPYITVAVALLSVPSVGYFARLLSEHAPGRVLTALLVVLALGLLALWPFATRVDAAVVLFYLWTALGTLLLTSGFWVVTSEYFAVRGAKRLYGLIGAGGTAGAMVMGNSLVWLTRRLDLIWLVALLVGILALFYVTQALLPPSGDRAAPDAREARPDSSMRESLRVAWRSPHLRTIGLIVLTATIATTVLDYQFKELVRGDLQTGEQLTSFFGAFYGWTGAISLLVQLLLASRLMASGGIALSLSILPITLLLGSAGLLLVPGVILATVVRGADNSLRRSLHRAVLEVLYVPVPGELRRKTKTFIDSVVDSVGEGLGAAIVFLWVTLSALPSRYLSIYVIVFSAVFLYLSRRMGRQYFHTVTQRLQEGGADAERLSVGARLEGRDLITGTFTQLDMGVLRGSVAAADRDEVSTSEVSESAGPETVAERLTSTDLRTVARTLEERRDWDEAHIPLLIRTLARDPLYSRATTALLDLGKRAVPHLVDVLRDEATDFVIRRRVPRILARLDGETADDALLDALSATRFEVRYRAAMALVRRRRNGLPTSRRDVERRVWEAIRTEVSKERPVWELQRLLDGAESEGDELVSQRVGVRGELSLEHTFRLLTLILDGEAVRAAYQGILTDEPKLKGFALEYLEQVLPPDVRKKLWPFIGDVSEYQREKGRRPLDAVVNDLMTTSATLFAGEEGRAALRRILDEEDRG